ncbi:hypothetical protein DFR50_12718 [Roseiarcus fermentans]|uniref:DUF4239 domain-containing protein n=1 Tax=Roseiarcus fermentans TaxID=1473586 RepID=A0A366EYA4_9HYPH|nr:hypothetical protein [Roseiarcus fermentans]RBP07373.1 hypothetical protein DFR50_12718 [Roseiarcus fermentans]
MHTSTHRVMIAACVIFVGAVAGHFLQELLPAHHLSEAKSVITTVQGLVTALLALVLGLLIWTGYGVYAQQNSEMMTLIGQVLQLDVLLDRLGADGVRARALQREQLIAMRKRFWEHDGAGPPVPYQIGRAELSRMDAFFAATKAATDEERALFDQARSLAASVVMTILLMGRQLRNPVPHGLINSVILWAGLVFCCLGATATLSVLSVAVEFVGALSVASAIFLILEFSQPYDGHFRISPDSIDHVIAALASSPTP